MKIAILVDESENIVSFNEPGILKLYEMDENGWRCIREVQFKPDLNMNLTEIRRYIYMTASQLDDCKSLVTRKTVGIFNAIFEEELGLKIWTVAGSSLEALNQIKEEGKSQTEHHSTETESDPKDETPFTAIDNTGDGIYRVNMVKIQKKNSSFTSKDILLPCLKERKFRELEVICLHPPKWFDSVLETLNLEFKAEELKDGLCLLSVYPKTTKVEN
jgi:Fe-only nitrogenase accessory protein AnfO